MAELHQTKRTELVAAYDANQNPYIATTRGLHSTRSLRFDVVNRDAATNQVGYLVAARGQVLNFFNYGINDQIELGNNANHRATEADTSLTKGMRTTASADLAIEWITAGPRALKVAYAAAAATPIYPAFVATVDPAAAVAAALNGQRPMVDPFAKIIPADIGASATLEQVLYHAAAPFLTCRFEWDNADRTEKIGPLKQFVEGSGASYLHANGEPSVQNRFRIPEGFHWAREGQPASEMQVIVTLQEDIVIPYTPNAALLGATTPVLSAAFVEITMYVGGLLLRVPGTN